MDQGEVGLQQAIGFDNVGGTIYGRNQINRGRRHIVYFSARMISGTRLNARLRNKLWNDTD